MVEAAQNSKKTAEDGDVESMRFLGEAHYMGLGVEKSMELAEHWFQRAAEKNDPTALYRLGQMYTVVYDEYEKAEEYIRRAIAAGPILNVTQEEIDIMLSSIATFSRIAKNDRN